MAIELGNKLIQEFGKTIEIPNLTLDEQGYCCLQFDNITTHLQYNEESEQLVIFVNLGPLSADTTPQGVANLLAANLFWMGTRGATLALEPEINNVHILDKIRVRGLDNTAFLKWIETFVDTAEKWTKRIASGNINGPEVPGADDKTQETSPEFA